MARRKNEAEFEVSSGNVFADLGLPNADEENAKVRLAMAINGIIRNLNQMEAARRLKTKQPNVSALRNYRLDGFSAERLMHFLNALEYDVEIVVRKKPRSRTAAIVVTGVTRPGRSRAAAKRKSQARSHESAVHHRKYA